MPCGMYKENNIAKLERWRFTTRSWPTVDNRLSYRQNNTMILVILNYKKSREREREKEIMEGVDE